MGLLLGLWTVNFHNDNDGVPDDTRGATAIFEPDGTDVLLDGTDIAIIRMSAAAPAYAPPIPLANSNPLAVQARAVGFGLNGLGATGHNNTGDGLRWGIDNTIDAFGQARAFGGAAIPGTANIFNTDFDDNTPGNNSLGSQVPLTNEGTTAPGDSGGPLLVGGEIVGVLSGGTSPTSQFGDVSWWTGSLTHMAFITTNAPGATFGTPAAPANDDFANADTLTGVSDSVTGDNNNATAEVGEPGHGATGTPDSSVWWSWTAPVSEMVTIDTEGSDFDTSLGVHTGAMGTLATVTDDDDSGTGLLSSVTFSAMAGTTYHIAVDGFNGAQGNIQLNLEVAEPANNDHVNAFVLNGHSATDTSQTVTADGQVGEPNHSPSNSVPLESVWWRWTAPLDGETTIDTEGSDFDTTLAVYTGSLFPSLVPIAGDDDSGTGNLSSVTFDAVQGTTYRIAVDGFSGADGNVQINLDQDPEISIDDVSMDEGTIAGPGITSFDFTVSRSHNFGAASVQVDTALGATNPATPVDDYTALTGLVVNFVDGGALTQTVTVDVVADELVEEDQTFFVNLSNPVGATILDDQGLGTIENDDELIVEFSQIEDDDAETSGGNLPVLLISGEVEKTQTVTIVQDVAQNPATLGSDFDWGCRRSGGCGHHRPWFVRRYNRRRAGPDYDYAG